MPHTRIKICGITRPEDAALAAEFGADAIGLNFIGGPRLLSGEQAVEILKATPPMVTVVSLLFLDQEYFSHWADVIEASNKHLHYHFWNRVRQFYGITEAFIPGLRANIGGITDRPDTWLPLKVENRDSVFHLKIRIGRLGLRPGALVLDTASPDKLGGTGQSFNWHWIAEARAAGELDGLPPIILAGGLTPENVAAAIKIAQPYAVDVSSGVEIPGKPGIKDPIKMRDFIQAVRAADQ